MIGEAFALVAVLSFALGNAAVTKALSSGRGGDNGALLSVVLTTVLALALYLALLGERTIWNAPDAWRGVVWFAVAGLLATAIGRGTLFRSIALSGAITAGMFRRLIPVFAALLALLVLGERVTAFGAVGMVLIAVSIIVAATVPARDATGPKAPAPGRFAGQFYGSASALAYGAAYVTASSGWTICPTRRSARRSVRSPPCSSRHSSCFSPGGGRRSSRRCRGPAATR